MRASLALLVALVLLLALPAFARSGPFNYQPRLAPISPVRPPFDPLHQQLSESATTLRSLFSLILLESLEGNGPRNYTLYLQCNTTWGSAQLGTSSSDTICSAGCAMTSLSMVLNTFSEKAASKTINPGTFNAWLTANNGYVDSDLLVWAAADSLGVVKFNQYYTGSGSLPLSQMQQLVSEGHPIIANVLNGSHWVLVTGYSGSNFIVNDPAAFHPTYDYSGMSRFVVYDV